VGVGVSDAAATIVRDAFLAYREAFAGVTRRAAVRFAARDWASAQRDSVERLELYARSVDAAIAALERGLGPAARERRCWAGAKERYAAFISGRPDRELGETFFNSVTRRLFETLGVDAALEFVASDFARGAPPLALAYERLSNEGRLTELAARLLRRFELQAPWDDLDRDAALFALRLAAAAAAWPGGVLAADVVPSPFYRGKGAYLVGRVCGRGERQLPLVLGLLNERGRVRLDAVLLDEDSASIVFGFTRAYFAVDAPQPGALVAFLKTVMPGKRVAELYIALGHNKHGKTELYRDLASHLEDPEARFERAPGERGMVMAVFTLPRFDHVFKVIRDRFPEPKSITREGVMEKYALVFRHDRAGRLIDAQEFAHLRFARSRFAPEVLDELLGQAGSSVSVAGDQVDIRHMYVERRLVPLNLHVQQASPGAARAAVVDYGQAIRDLASTNIFPGDVLLKNFGVTRHGRVVFYDYDELARVTDCCFRRLPPPRNVDEEHAAEPWFYVAPNDVFPEEFARFLGLRPPLFAAFRQAHGELLTAEYWQGLKRRLEEGEIVDVFPYRPEQRLPRARTE
jgi:isocitrate dehydrogenase kinase/phosphatase